MVKERGLFQGITRFKYDGEGYNLNESLQLVEAIGKQRNPKFVIDDENRFTYENIIKWLHCDHSMKAIHPDTKQEVPGDMHRGIYIAGNTGSGKSWCMEVMLVYADLFHFKINVKFFPYIVKVNYLFTFVFINFQFFISIVFGVVKLCK